MPVTIENPQSLSIERYERNVFRKMFADYKRLVIRSRLTGGLSGSNVYLVRPIMEDGAELPSVVKIDLYERINQEWTAYQTCVKNRLSKVANISGEPVNPPGSPLSGLSYPLAGAGIDEITSLHQYLLTAPVDKIGSFLKQRLFRYFSEWWGQTGNHYDYYFRAAYDDFLPLNLKIQRTAAEGPTGWLHPDTIDEREWAIGDYVQASGFKVVKLLRDKQGISLDAPESYKGFRFHLYGVEDVEAYEIGEVIQRPFTGRIIDNRQEQLLQQAQNAVGADFDLQSVELTLPDGRKLPNPLQKWQEALRRSMDVKVACIHGDLNMENVLVEQDTETIHLIDFAKSDRDHVLRDLLHLEMTVINKIMSKTEGEAATTIHDLYQRLHCSVVQEINIAPPAGHERTFTIIKTIRETASPLLYQSKNWQEYYNGLFIYLLGSLRFGDLDKMDSAPRPKQLAFWGAATILDLMENEPDCRQLVKTKTVPKQTVPDIKPELTTSQEADSNWDIDKIVSDWQANPLSQRLIFFNILKSSFTLDELRGLMYQLGMDFDDLPLGSKSIKVQELIGYFERRGQIRRLLEAASTARTDIPWG